MTTITLQIPDELAIRLEAERDRLPQLLEAALVDRRDPAGAADPLDFLFDCDDNDTFEVGPQPENSAACSFADNGTFEVNARVEDGDGGFVPGGGWIMSPAGAYLADACLIGKAMFGFNSKYKPGNSVPEGKTDFEFKAGDFKFRSTNYEVLIVQGHKAQFKGEGTVNGTGLYKFILTAYDGQAPGGGGVDKFRIKIWNATGGHEVVYDNRRGVSDDMDDADSQAIGGGSIVIHKP